MEKWQLIFRVNLIAGLKITFLGGYLFFARRHIFYKKHCHGSNNH